MGLLRFQLRLSNQLNAINIYINKDSYLCFYNKPICVVYIYCMCKNTQTYLHTVYYTSFEVYLFTWI